MPKIKNWSKVDEYEWKHDSKNAEVYIGLEGTGYRPTFAKYYTERGRNKRRTKDLGRKTFSTKTAAKKYARHWMKNHPNP